jgi:hypothetical protein
MNYTLPARARFAFYAVGLAGALGITAAEAAFLAMHIPEPLWLAGVVAGWVVLSGALHTLAMGNMPDWTNSSTLAAYVSPDTTGALMGNVDPAAFAGPVVADPAPVAPVAAPVVPEPVPAAPATASAPVAPPVAPY